MRVNARGALRENARMDIILMADEEVGSVLIGFLQGLLELKLELVILIQKIWAIPKRPLRLEALATLQHVMAIHDIAYPIAD
jgi:hypothetical protein